MGWILLAAVLAAGGCQAGCSARPGNASAVLRLATTTSTRDSGLLDLLLPVFQEAENCRVDVVAVGTGAALKLAERGDVDVVLVHAPDAERVFLDAGHATRREELMYNFFTILGPGRDPARIGTSSAAEAVQRIARGGQRFVSRGDDSGTHKRELSLWQATGDRPSWDGYVESGQGMGATLVMADELRAYVLADQGTYLSFRDKIELVPLVTASEQLRNPYSVLPVNPDKHPGVNGRLAELFADFLTSAEVQRMIAGYEIAGQSLFVPTRLPANE